MFQVERGIDVSGLELGFNILAIRLCKDPISATILSYIMHLYNMTPSRLTTSRMLKETMHFAIRMLVDAEIKTGQALSPEDVFAGIAKLNRPIPGMPEISEQTLYEQIKEAYYYTPERKRLKTK